MATCQMGNVGKVFQKTRCISIYLDTCIHIKKSGKWDSSTWLTLLRLDEMKIREIRRLGPTTTKKSTLPPQQKASFGPFKKWCVSWWGEYFLLIFWVWPFFGVHLFKTEGGEGFPTMDVNNSKKNWIPLNPPIWNICERQIGSFPWFPGKLGWEQTTHHW